MKLSDIVRIPVGISSTNLSIKYHTLISLKEYSTTNQRGQIDLETITIEKLRLQEDLGIEITTDKLAVFVSE